MHLLPRLIRDVERTLDDNFHLIVCVRVHERCALLEAVEACRYGFFGVDLFAAWVLLVLPRDVHGEGQPREDVA